MQNLGDAYGMLAVTAPFAAAVAIAFGPPRWAEVFTYLAAGATLWCSAHLLPAVATGAMPSAKILTLVPGLDLSFRVDALGLTFGLLASALWVVTSVYSSGYVRADRLQHRRRYFGCFAASIGSALGVAYAGNLLTFLLFYELLTLATYPLVLHKESPAAVAAARKYLLYALSGGLALTVATIWTWQVAGTLDFAPGGFLQGKVSGAGLTALFALFAFGCGVKAAVMPLHSWLPSAMVAPSPVSALLHAVAVVKAGVFGFIRVLTFVFGPQSLAESAGPALLLTACIVTIVLGSFVAVRQDNLKRRLAYSTIVHLSYIVMGVALLTPNGLVGSVLHLVNHGLAKITLFFCAGAIYATTHIENVSELRGLAYRMPWTFAAFALASFGLMGVPCMAGFVSKYFLCQGTIEAGEWLSLGVLLSASVFSAAYLVPVLTIGCTKDEPGAAEHPAPHGGGGLRAALTLPLVGTALLVAIFGMFPAAMNAQYDLARQVAARVFGGAS